MNVKEFKEVTNNDSIVREYILIKNPDIKVLDYREKFKDSLNMTICFTWGHSYINIDLINEERRWKFLEYYIIGKNDDHKYLLNDLSEGIRVKGMNLKTSGMIMKFLIEHPT